MRHMRDEYDGSPGPGQYGQIKDWNIEQKRKSFNLRYL